MLDKLETEKYKIIVDDAAKWLKTLKEEKKQAVAEVVPSSRLVQTKFKFSLTILSHKLNFLIKCWIKRLKTDQS